VSLFIVSSPVNLNPGAARSTVGIGVFIDYGKFPTLRIFPENKNKKEIKYKNNGQTNHQKLELIDYHTPAVDLLLRKVSDFLAK
jgi:hypothetical protein